MSQPVLRFVDAVHWRRWLEAHHATATEAVLLLAKKDVPRGLHYPEALEEAICFGWIDGKLRAHDAERFVQRFSPRRPESIWSEANRKRATRLRKEGRMTEAGLATIRDAKRSGAWQDAYRVSRVPRLPADLGTALRANPVARAHFRAWANSYRSACIRWVTSAKRETTRAQRIRRVVQRAAEDRRPGIEGF